MKKIILCPECIGIGETLVDVTNYHVHPADITEEHRLLMCLKCEGSGRLVKEVTYKAYKVI